MKQKGMEEIVWMVVIVVATIIMALFLYNQRFRGVEVIRSVEERVVSESGTSLLLSLSVNKPPHIEKYYSQMLIDAVLEGNFWATNPGRRVSEERINTDKVFYGIGIGTVNLTEIIPQIINKFTSNNWRLTVVTPDGIHSYGDIKLKNTLYSYEVLVPVPEERIGKIVFEMS